MTATLILFVDSFTKKNVNEANEKPANGTNPSQDIWGTIGCNDGTFDDLVIFIVAQTLLSFSGSTGEATAVSERQKSNV